MLLLLLSIVNLVLTRGSKPQNTVEMSREAFAHIETLSYTLIEEKYPSTNITNAYIQLGKFTQCVKHPQCLRIGCKTSSHCGL